MGPEGNQQAPQEQEQLEQQSDLPPSFEALNNEYKSLPADASEEAKDELRLQMVAAAMRQGKNIDHLAIGTDSEAIKWFHAREKFMQSHHREIRKTKSPDNYKNPDRWDPTITSQP